MVPLAVEDLETAVAIPLALLWWTALVAVLYILMRTLGTLSSGMARLKASLLLLVIWSVGELTLFALFSRPSGLIIDWIPIVVQAPFLFLVLSVSDIVYQYHQIKNDFQRSGTQTSSL